MVKVDCMTPPIHTYIPVCFIHMHPWLSPVVVGQSAMTTSTLCLKILKLQPIGALNILHAQAMDRSVINLVSFNQILFAQ